MRKYNQPETKFLQVVNSSIICISPGPASVGQLGSMKNGVIQMGTMSSTESSSY